MYMYKMQWSNNEQGEEGAKPLRFSLLRTPGVFVIGLLFWWSLTGMGAGPPLVGSPAPDFTLSDLSGKEAQLSDLRGRPILVTFWATWCPPCKKEMPEIQAAYDQHKDRGFVVLAVNFGENLEAAKVFVNQMDLRFPVLLDRKVNVASRYGVWSLPVSFFIDRNGIIQERVFGGTLTTERIGEILRQLQERERGKGPFLFDVDRRTVKFSPE